MKFGTTLAVDRIDLTVPKGQICGLLGPNGAGKTTAIRMICGVLVPNSGSIEIDGTNLIHEIYKEIRRIIHSLET